MAKQKVIRSTLEGPLEKSDGRRPRHQYDQGACATGGCRHVIFLILVLTDIADFVSDWLFFVDVYIVEKGLVYGPPDRAAVWSLFAFSVVGTFTFVAEVTNLWWETYRHNPWVDSDALSAVVIWIEDIPQVIISLTIALCREEPISVFQLSKAAVVLIGIVIRIIISLAKYCNRKELQSHYHVQYKAIIMIGMILEALAAGAIFFLTQTERGPDGTHVSFKVPTTIIEDRYNDQRYFANVSIFLHHADFFDAGPLDPDKTDYKVNWIRLVSINKIRDSSSARREFSLDYEYDTARPDVLKFGVWEKLVDTTGQWNFTECYEVDRTTAGITEVDAATCTGVGYFANPSTATLTFQYTRPEKLFKKKVFGDIHFNMKLESNGYCKVVTNYTDSIEGSVDRNIPVTIHYYRTSADLPPQGTRHLLHDNNSAQPRFFRNDGQDLIDIELVWKTGWNECDSTGSLAPNVDGGLKVDCNRS